MKTYLIFALTLFGFWSSPLFSKEGSGSHGGSLVFVKGKWTLSDLFVKTDAGDEVLLSKDMKYYLEETLQLIEKYNLNLNPLRNALFGEESQYFYVTKEDLPCKDDPMPIEKNEGNASKIIQMSFGCTIGHKTYFVRERLDLLKKTNPEEAFKIEALAIIHERLHTLMPETEIPVRAHEKIAAFTTAAYKMISLAEDQNETFLAHEKSKPTGEFGPENAIADEMRELFISELQTLKNIESTVTAVNAGKKRDPKFTVKIYRRGGGAIFFPEGTPESDQIGRISALAGFIGVGSRIFDPRHSMNSTLGQILGHVALINSTIYRASDSSFHILGYSTLINSEINRASDMEGTVAELSDSSIVFKTRFYIRNSWIEGASMFRDFWVENAYINYSRIFGGEVTDSQIIHSSAVFDSKINKTKLDYSTVKNSEINNCQYEKQNIENKKRDCS
jgi:hypothetical protein